MNIKQVTPKNKLFKLTKCSEELRKIKNCENLKIKKQLINKANNCVIDVISEIAKNCLLGNLPLKTCDFEKLKRYKKQLRLLSKKSSFSTRKHLINQKGGEVFLDILIKQALSLLNSYVNDKLNKKLNKQT